MESSSSPLSKDNEKTKTTVTEADDECNYRSLGSPGRNFFQEAVMAILRCLGFKRENVTAQVVESGSTGSGAEKESEGKERDSSSSPQLKEEGSEGDGGAASAVLSVLSRSLPAQDPPLTATSQDDVPLATTTSSLAFQRPTGPPLNTGSGGQHN